MDEFRVELGERSYPFYIGAGIIKEAGALIRQKGLQGRILVVTNPTVAQWYLEPLLASLTNSGYRAEHAIIPDGEEYKSLEQAVFLYDYLVDLNYDRSSVLLALGGGVIGDLTGFVAATYMRGIKFIQVPTTLLAQVDSSIGGKVAVNHPRGKNLIGAFYQPQLVISDVTTFKTLPEREFSSGMAEVVKHGVILDPEYLKMVSVEIEAIKARETEIMARVVGGSCRIKSNVVAADEQETGLRAVLNFGHTLGHALESVTNYTSYKHGEAIAVGMLFAVKLASKINLLKDQDMAHMLEQMLQNLNLPTRIPGLGLPSLLLALKLDKKVELGKIRWVLPLTMGEVVVTQAVPGDLIEETLLEMGGVR